MPNKESISVGKSDIIWSYIAKFLGIASGLLVLPFILNRLTAEEMGLNYLMLTIGSMVAFHLNSDETLHMYLVGLRSLQRRDFQRRKLIANLVIGWLLLLSSRQRWYTSGYHYWYS